MALSILGIALACIAIGLNIGKLLYSRHEEAKRKNQEPAEINLDDHVPGAVIEPKDIPERDLDDFDI